MCNFFFYFGGVSFLFFLSFSVGEERSGDFKERRSWSRFARDVEKREMGYKMLKFHSSNFRKRRENGCNVIRWSICREMVRLLEKRESEK